METLTAEAPPAQATRLYTVHVAAETLGVSDRYVWQLIADGELSAVRLGRRTLIRDDELAAYIEAHTTRAS